MKLDLNNITFIIVSFKSENVIHSCLNSLPQISKKIVIENSRNTKLKEELESKYDNIEVLINHNIGMGASNNIGILQSKTQFAYILNPDTKLNVSTIDKLIEAADKIVDFAILSPLCSDSRFPNYKIYEKKSNLNNNIIEVDTIDGFSMLINKSKFNNSFFDENIFLYLENDDICLRARKNNQKIYIVKNSLIDHLGASSSNIKDSYEFDLLRNWHWMWSKFYYNKKHSGFLISTIKIFPNFLSAIIKYTFYLLLFKNQKRKIYKMRLLGIINAFIGKKSFYRID
tara:strand:- start:135 stop:989 length:855 start_codon:yes stop_codon:yes gene_type:complete